MAAKTISKGVTLYTAGTPNGWKASIALKEMNYPHTVQSISMSDNEQKQDWFLKINPNGRIPAIVDHDNGDYPVFETGAILQYLGEKSGKFYPREFNKRHEVNQWLFFQNAGVGPMQGQANHFCRFAPEKIPYGMKRYVNETKRLYEVLDARLKDHEYLAADEYTIADMTTIGWVFFAHFAGVDVSEFANLKRWMDTLMARPAVIDGLKVPSESDMLKDAFDDAKRKEKIDEVKAMLAH